MTENEFDICFGKLCKRWGKKFNAGQAEIYYDFVKTFEFGRFSLAVSNILGCAKLFPTPDELRNTYFSVSQNSTEDKKNDCKHCDNGFVEFTIGKVKYANPCAHCRKASAGPLVTKVGKAIFYAYRKAPLTEEPLYYSFLSKTSRIEGAIALGETEEEKDVSSHQKLIRKSLNLR